MFAFSGLGLKGLGSQACKEPGAANKKSSEWLNLAEKFRTGQPTSTLRPTLPDTRFVLMSGVLAFLPHLGRTPLEALRCLGPRYLSNEHDSKNHETTLFIKVPVRRTLVKAPFEKGTTRSAGNKT